MPDFFNIVSCLLALGAFGAAIHANRISRDLQRIESSRDARAQAQEERRDAELVRVFIALAAGRTKYVVIDNASSGVIRDLAISTVGMHTTRAIPKFDLQPGKHQVLPSDRSTPQGKKYDWGVATPLAAESIPVPLSATRRSRVTAFEFTDARGLRWLRDDNGLLSRVVIDETTSTTNAALA